MVTVLTVMEPTIEYVFGLGDGLITSWTSAPDLTLGTAGPDAVRIDFDGDGRFDDAMWDRDGDGSADCSVLDLDDDGRPDMWFTDNGSGVWASELEPGGADLSWVGPEGDRHTSRALPDTEGACAGVDVVGDGKTEDRACDRDSDGRAEILVLRTGGRVYLDTDLDDRLDHVLVDTDRDGTADTAFTAGDPGFDL